VRTKLSVILVFILIAGLILSGCIFGKKDNGGGDGKPPDSSSGDDTTSSGGDDSGSPDDTGTSTGGDSSDSSGPVEPKGDPFIISFNNWIGYAPMYIAKEKGFFGDLNVQFEVTDDIEAQRQSFKDGEYHTTAETVDSFANGAPSGLQGKAVLKVDDSLGGDGIICKSDIKTINDLKGKTIAFAQGQPSHFFLLYLLSIAGLSSEDITAQYEDPDMAAESFKSGKVEAAVTWEPYLSEASSQGGKILVSTKEAEGLIVDVIVVSDDVIKNRPDDVQKMVEGWFKAVEYYKMYPEEAKSIMATGMEISPEEFDEMLSGIKFSDLADNKAYFGKDVKHSTFVEVFDTAGEIWVEEKLISEPVMASDLYTTSFVDKVNNDKIVAYVEEVGSAPEPEPTKAPEPGATEVAVEEPTAPPVKPTAKPKPTVAPTKVPEKPTGEVLVQLDVPPIYFDTGSANIDKNSHYVIDEVAKTLLHFKTLFVRIEGHTDSDGDDQMNLELSQERAQSVANYILKNYPQIDKKRLLVKGFGETKPVASNDTEDGKSKNRRTEFYITK